MIFQAKELGLVRSMAFQAIHSSQARYPNQNAAMVKQNTSTRRMGTGRPPTPHAPNTMASSRGIRAFTPLWMTNFSGNQFL